MPGDLRPARICSCRGAGSRSKAGAQSRTRSFAPGGARMGLAQDRNPASAGQPSGRTFAGLIDHGAAVVVLSKGPEPPPVPPPKG